MIPASVSQVMAERRRQALLLVVISMVIARSAPFHAKGLDVISLKAWREARRAKKEERRRRDMETPLYA
jgi:hypothetical protein